MPICEPAPTELSRTAAEEPPAPGRYHVRCVQVQTSRWSADFTAGFEICDGLPRGQRGRRIRLQFPDPTTLPAAAAAREHDRRAALARATRLIRPGASLNEELPHVNWSDLPGRQCVLEIAIQPHNADSRAELVESQIYHVFDRAVVDVPKDLADLLECPRQAG